MSWLIFKRGADAGKRIRLAQFPTTLGRDDENDIVVNDNNVSRFHLRIRKRQKIFVLEDLDSRNGTYLNGDRVLNSTLENGDRILLGGTEIMFAAKASDIEFARDNVNFDFVVVPKIGIQGPAKFKSVNANSYKNATRIELNENLNQPILDARLSHIIHEILRDLSVSQDLKVASDTLLRGIHKLCPKVKKSLFFVYNSQKAQLIPVSSGKFDAEGSDPFRVSQQVLEEAITRKRAIVSKGQEKAGEHFFIVPLIFQNEVVGAIHSQVSSTIEEAKIDALISLISLSSSIFETLMLKRDLDSWMMGTVETLIATIEAKDTYTIGHSERVCQFCMAIADELKLKRETKKLLMISAVCHDIGKIGIPDAILKKASLLSTEEYDEMKLHPLIGAEIMVHLPNAQKFISGVKYHHEKWDGTGYPEGLVGEDIPFFGRIVAVADVFDAMVSGRSYSGFLDESDAIERILSERDLFDPEILKALGRAWDRGSMTQRTSTVGKSSKK